MTAEDLEQIKQIVESVFAELRQEFRAELDRFATAVRANQERAAEYRSASLTQFRGELRASLQAVEERLNQLAPAIFSLDARVSAFGRSLDRLVGSYGETASTQAAQQRAIDQLAARVVGLCGDHAVRIRRRRGS